MVFEGSSLLQQSPESPEKQQNHLKVNKLIICLLLVCSCYLQRRKCRIRIGLLLGFLRLRNTETQLAKYLKIKINSQSPSWHAKGDGGCPESISGKSVANSSFSRDKEVDAQRKKYRQEEVMDTCLLIFVMCRKTKLMVQLLVNGPTDFRAVKIFQFVYPDITKLSDEKIWGFNRNIRYDNSRNARLWDDSKKAWTSKFQVKTEMFNLSYLQEVLEIRENHKTFAQATQPKQW